MEWNVKNAVNRDVERQHLNKILKEIKEAIDNVPAAGVTEQRVQSLINSAINANGIPTQPVQVTLAGDVTGNGSSSNGNVVVLTTLDESKTGISDAPLDAFPYWRRTGQWEQVPDEILNGTGGSSLGAIGAAFDAGEEEIIAGDFAEVRIPYGMNISKVSVICTPSGDISFDIYNCLWNDRPPSPGDVLFPPTSRPTVTGDTGSEDDTLEDWVLGIEAGSVFRFVVASASGVSKANILLEGTRT